MKINIRLVASLMLCMALSGISRLIAQEPDKDPFLHWMDEIAQRQLRDREKTIAGIHTVAEAEHRKQYVREKLLELLGGLPNYSGPLNAKITGQIQADGYTIEKLIFESLPNFYVTADVYRPNQPGRYPGVLLQAGHTQEGKPEDQRLAANLALKGYVVLAFDPIGQGEREQTYDPLIGGAAAGWSVPEHIQAGAEAQLINEGLGRFFIWDAKRALDYLESRPDVDASHLGAAGCSGGGALTTYFGALDKRLKAVAPSCFTQSLHVLFTGPDPDSEMSFPKSIASGLDHADFAELAAPTPWLFLATEGDFFTPTGAKMVYDEVQRWYALYGAEDKVHYFVGHGPHGTPLETRRIMYEWFNRWLKNGQGDDRELPVHQYTNFELLATSTGHVDDLPGSRKVYQLIMDDLRAKKQPGTIPELLAELRKLGVPTDGTPPDVKVVDDSRVPEGRLERIRFESEPGVELDAKLYIPSTPGPKPAVLLVADKSSNYWIPSTEALAKRMAKLGRVVLALEVRDSPGEQGRPYIGNWQTNARADQIGLNLPAMRAHDILRGIDVLTARSEVDPASIRAVARDAKGVWLLLAAAADSRISKIWLDRTPYSMREALNRPMNLGLYDAVIPGFALHWDLDDLTKAMGSRPVLWTDPKNWLGKDVSLGPAYRYRYVIGDTTDLLDAQDNEIMDDFLK